MKKLLALFLFPFLALGQGTPTVQVKTTADLVALPIPTVNNRMSAIVSGYSTTNDGGGGIFTYDSSSTNTQDGGTAFKPNSANGRWLRNYNGPVNVRWFGASGDGTGRTPSDSGNNILTNVWNKYPVGSSYYDPAYTPDNTITTNTLAFANTDSWDTIGIQLATWYHRSVYAPDGEYWLTRPIQLVRGMENNINGDGMLKSNFNYKDQATFGTRPQSGLYKPLINLYRVGGPPTTIQGVGFTGPSGSTNGIGVYSINCNGVTISQAWFMALAWGLVFDAQSTDNNVSRLTAEYCAQQVIYCDNSDLLRVDDCNFWQTSSSGAYGGIRCAAGANYPGNVEVNGSRFMGFGSYSIYTDGSAIVTGSYFDSSTGGATAPNSDFIVKGGARSVVTGNRFVGVTNGGHITVDDNSVVGSNTTETTSDYANVVIDGNNVSVVNNNIIHTSVAAGAANRGIYIASGTNGVIAGNILTGGANAGISGNQSTYNIYGNNLSTYAGDFVYDADLLHVTKSGKLGVNTNVPASTMHILTPGSASALTIGDTQTGNTSIAFGTSAASNGHGDMQVTRQSGSSYGNIRLNASGGSVVVGFASGVGASKFAVNGGVNIGDDADVGANNLSVTGGDIKMVTAGRGLYIKEGSNARMGASVLVGGSNNVANTSITANTRIFLTSQVDGGTPGFLRVLVRTNATSFTIMSSSAIDTSTVGWLLVEPSP